MTEDEKELLEILNNLKYGEIVVKKEAGKIVHVVEKKSIKLGSLKTK